MTIDWVYPFKIAFELGMFALGWLLVVIIVAFFVFLTYAIVKATIQAIRKQEPKTPRKSKKEPNAGIITFDKK